MTHQIEHTVTLPVSPELAFRWYTELDNVRRMTPPELHLRILKAETPLAAGSRVLFSIRPKFLPFEINWLLQIEAFETGRRFSERLLKGPFDHWVHSHEFTPLPDGGCRIIDRIEWAGPTILLRAVASDDYINSKLLETFHHREAVIRGALSEASAAGTS